MNDSVKVEIIETIVSDTYTEAAPTDILEVIKVILDL